MPNPRRNTRGTPDMRVLIRAFRKRSNKDRSTVEIWRELRDAGKCSVGYERARQIRASMRKTPTSHLVYGVRKKYAAPKRGRKDADTRLRELRDEVTVLRVEKKDVYDSPEWRERKFVDELIALHYTEDEFDAAMRGEPVETAFGCFVLPENYRTILKASWRSSEERRDMICTRLRAATEDQVYVLQDRGMKPKDIAAEVGQPLDLVQSILSKPRKGGVKRHDTALAIRPASELRAAFMRDKGFSVREIADDIGITHRQATAILRRHDRAARN